jgi:MFS family permease
MFMSFSGGATPASLPAIEERVPDMGQTEIGLLGSLDKIGCVFASVFWGWALQRFPTKLCLCTGLILCAGFSYMFGFAESKYAMFFAKLMQGCTESQQIVWGNLWTTARAPRESLSWWMNMGGVAAGAGTAIGTAVAGFGIAWNMPYCFAYAVQAAILALLWVALLLTPASWVSLQRQRREHVAQIPFRVLFKKRLYWYTMLCVAQNNFIVGGLQFFWTRFFFNGPWHLDMKIVTTTNLLVNGLGMILGIVFGPVLMNMYGGYTDDLGRYVTLRLLLRITALTVFGAGFVILATGMQLSVWGDRAWNALHVAGSDEGLMDSSLWNPWLWVFWVATVPINFSLAAQGGVQTVINIGSVPEGLQEFAQGVTTSVQNLFGYAGGVIIPSAVIDASYYVGRRSMDYEMTTPDQLSVGVSVVCGAAFSLFATVFLAMREAGSIWRRNGESGGGPLARE